MLKSVNYLWRLFATAMCFSLFGAGALVLTLFVFPIQKLCIRGEQAQKRTARKTVHYSFRFFIATMAFTRIFEFDLRDKAELAQRQGQLILANHPSLIDVVVLLSIIPNADCVVKAHLFSNPFIRGVIKNTGYISNADPESLLSACKSSLEQGNNLIIFPEGTRTVPGKEVVFQRGAANIALRCEVPITTVLINVTPTTLTKAESWYQIPSEKAKFTLQLTRNVPLISIAEATPMSKQVRHYCRELENYFKQELLPHE
ncbi:1-acyl-sn-glycerol-3-phosphate acyltransferase [Moritella sp. 24]|uniref:lysophospholipid acyltransferase family protein n=1 Tax=Moritella sp. 24 TaxID=2746230 RepID=UPI001BADF25F|nr:lysophospholipid acyltransferase family protein [Moritella sp. 24]QUM76035.1 1-acyl-sn-glycerol-3-phosphate acyltransferase [Moritella sp. 24]